MFAMKQKKVFAGLFIFDYNNDVKKFCNTCYLSKAYSEIYLFHPISLNDAGSLVCLPSTSNA